MEEVERKFDPKEKTKQIIKQAKHYLKNNTSKNGNEPSEEYCIIFQLLKIIER